MSFSLFSLEEKINKMVADYQRNLLTPPNEIEIDPTSFDNIIYVLNNQDGFVINFNFKGDKNTLIINGVKVLRGN